MQEVRGQLGKGVLPDVLRHAALLRDTGRLVLLSGTRQGLMVIRDGRPVHAACRRDDGSAATGLEALAALLGWEHGTYRFDALPITPPESGRTPESPEQGDTLAGDVETLLEAALARRATNGAAHHRSTPPDTDPEPVAPVEASDADVFASDPDDGAYDVDVFLLSAGSSPDVRPRSVMSRLDAGVATDDVATGDVALPRAALSLWLRLDGSTSIEEHAEALGTDVDRTREWAERLVQEGLAEVEPEPVVSSDFLPRLADELIEIMGPMGEILVEEAVYELDLDPHDLRVERMPALIDALASQLQRSDWRMRLRARATRLQEEMTIPPRTKEPR